MHASRVWHAPPLARALRLLNVFGCECVWECVCVCVCECVSVWVSGCVSVCAVKLGIQSGCWISVVTRMRRWRLAASFSATLCNQARPIGGDLIILERLVDNSFDSTQRGEEEGSEEGRVKRREEWRVKRWGQGVMCVCEVWSGRILAAELIRENIENSIRKKKWILCRFRNFQRRSFNGIPCRSKGQCSAYEAPTYWRFLSKPLLKSKKLLFSTFSARNAEMK